MSFFRELEKETIMFEKKKVKVQQISLKGACASYLFDLHEYVKKLWY